MAKTRHAKGRTKRKAPAKKPRKMMAAKKPARKAAKRGAKRMAKPAARRASKRARHAARMAPAAPIMIPIRAEAAKPQAMPAKPAAANMSFSYGGDSVMSALVGLLILIAVVSAGIFYPQIKSHQPSAAAPGTTQHK